MRQQNIVATMNILTTMAKSTAPNPSTLERDAMNTLAALVASNELVQAVREYVRISKSRWKSMTCIPDRNEESRRAHIALCKQNTTAWGRCMALLRDEGLYGLLPDLCGFLHYLAQADR